jgi:photosystem II stability/assembly factor-like uncharacterized protein
MLVALPAPPPTSIAFWDARRGLVGAGSTRGRARGEIELTTDGGRTFRVLLRTRAPVTSITVAGRSLAWAVTERCGARACARPRVIMTRDGGRSWNDTSARVGNPTFADARHGVAVTSGIGGDRVRLAWTSDGGRTWRSRRAPCPRVVGFNAAAALVSPTRGWLLCEGQGAAGQEEKAVYRTDDGGRRWRAVAETVFYPRRRVHGGLSSYGYPVGLAFARDSFGLLWESRGTLYVSRDGGRSWSGRPRVAHPEIDFGVAASVVRGGRAFILLARGRTNVRLVATSDYGRTWRLVRRF